MDHSPPGLAKMDEIDAEMWEISENLHRADYESKLERHVQIARWVELVELKRVISQSEKKPDGGRPEGGVAAAARELGISEPDARRAVNVATLSEEAKPHAAGGHHPKCEVIFGRGELSRAIYEELRNADGPLTSRDVARSIVALRGEDARERKYLAEPTKCVSKALRGMREDGLVRSMTDAKGNLMWAQR